METWHSIFDELPAIGKTVVFKYRLVGDSSYTYRTCVCIYKGLTDSGRINAEGLDGNAVISHWRYMTEDHSWMDD